MNTPQATRHNLRIFIVSLSIVFIGLAILFWHWSSRPYQQLKLERVVDTIVTEQKYGDLMGDKLTGSTAKEVPILLYHGILDSDDDGFSITKSKFNEQMVSLKKAGFSTITTNDYLGFLRGAKVLPEKSIMITFDDGRKDSYYRADPILKALDFQAVMFLTSGYSIVDGSRYYLDRDELLAMNETGRWDIEAHSDYAGTNQIVIDSSGTKGNFFGNLKWRPEYGRSESLAEYRTRVTTELRTVKEELDKLLGQGAVRTFAYPFGDYAQQLPNPKVSEVLQGETKKYYDAAYIQFRKGEAYSSNYASKTDYLSRRIEVLPTESGTNLVRALRVNVAKPSVYKASVSPDDGWQVYYGVIRFQKDGMLIVPKKGATASGIYLDGTKQLKDYSVTARFDLRASPMTNVELAALYQDKNNYLGCIFYDNRVVLEKVVGGVRTKLAESKMLEGYRAYDIGVRVLGDTGMQCTADGIDKVTSSTSNKNITGGPAIFVRNQTPDSAMAVLKSFSYTAN